MTSTKTFLSMDNEVTKTINLTGCSGGIINAEGFMKYAVETVSDGMTNG
jgi:hypothetical protein